MAPGSLALCCLGVRCSLDLTTLWHAEERAGVSRPWHRAGRWRVDGGSVLLGGVAEVLGIRVVVVALPIPAGPLDCRVEQWEGAEVALGPQSAVRLVSLGRPWSSPGTCANLQEPPGTASPKL